MNAKVLFEIQDIKMIKFVSTAGEDVTQTKAEKWKEYILESDNESRNAAYFRWNCLSRTNSKWEYNTRREIGIWPSINLVFYIVNYNFMYI